MNQSKKYITSYQLVALFILATKIHAAAAIPMSYEQSSQSPYGKINPDAPLALADYKLLIGTNHCTSKSIKQDGTWSKPIKMTWIFKYTMNGLAIHDQTFKSDGKHSGSIRQYSPKTDKWYVHYYAVDKITSTSLYSGEKKQQNIVLYKQNGTVKTPDGRNAVYRPTFFDITANAFNWVGEWVDEVTHESLGATWKINCVKSPE